MTSTTAIDKAAAAFKKEERRREGEQAMSEYRTAQAAELNKIERLKALRLANETAVPPAPAKVRAKKVRTNTKKK